MIPTKDSLSGGMAEPKNPRERGIVTKRRAIDHLRGRAIQLRIGEKDLNFLFRRGVMTKHPWWAAGALVSRRAALLGQSTGATSALFLGLALGAALSGPANASLLCTSGGVVGIGTCTETVSFGPASPGLANEFLTFDKWTSNAAPGLTETLTNVQIGPGGNVQLSGNLINQDSQSVTLSLNQTATTTFTPVLGSPGTFLAPPLTVSGTFSAGPVTLAAGASANLAKLEHRRPPRLRIRRSNESAFARPRALGRSGLVACPRDSGNARAIGLITVCRAPSSRERSASALIPLSALSDAPAPGGARFSGAAAHTRSAPDDAIARNAHRAARPAESRARA